jgi:serine/threonine protein kinase
VALKVLPFAATLDARQLQRFKNEAQAAAHLEHQNIVPVHAVGCERGVHYYAMQFIDGQTLAELIHELRGQRAKPAGEATAPYVATPPGGDRPAAEVATPAVAVRSTLRSSTGLAFFRLAAQLGVQAADALEHAHQLRIIHRDIKPGNLLVDGRGNLWIADFGLAHCQSQAGLTLTGDLMGTLRYMSPEQALAGHVEVDGRTDVYSLGATLYELLTLEPAFPGQDRQELLRQIAFEEPRPPRRLNKAIPAELETIVLKAMEKKPTERYATAKELAEDLRRFLDDEPIRARPAGFGRRARKWVKRRPALTTALVLLVAFGAVALAYRPPPPTSAELEQRAENEYRNAIATLEEEISQGRPISLIGPATRSVAHRWRAGQGRVSVPENSQEGRLVTISALEPSVLELLHDTGRSSYRLVVEMRQQRRIRATDAAEVAVSFAYRKYVTEEGPQFIFGRVKFADIGRRATLWKDRSGRPASLFQLGYYLLGATRAGIDRTHSVGGPYVLYPPAPANVWPGPWRRLEIEVRPGNFRAKHWDGAVVEMLPASKVPSALAIVRQQYPAYSGRWLVVDEGHVRALTNFRLKYPDFQSVQFPQAVQNSVGLFLEDSMVSLRRFDVEPLAEGE